MDEPSSQPPITESTSPTDPEALARLRRFGGDKLLREMIGLFLEAAPQRLATARAAAESGDVMSAELALHSLKSSAGQLGAAQIGRLSEQGERIARTGSLNGIPELVTEMEAELGRVATWLDGVRGAAAS